MQVTQKFLDGSLAYGIEDYRFKDDAELMIQKYEVNLEKGHSVTNYVQIEKLVCMLAVGYLLNLLNRGKNKHV